GAITEGYGAACGPIVTGATGCAAQLESASRRTGPRCFITFVARWTRARAPAWSVVLAFLLGDASEVGGGVGGRVGRGGEGGGRVVDLGLAHALDGVVGGVVEVEVLRGVLAEIEDGDAGGDERDQVGAAVGVLAGGEGAERLDGGGDGAERGQ